MIATLPMYARPWNRAAHDALWECIRDGLHARGVAAPDALDHDIDHMAGWGRDDLVLGQMCSLPLRAVFAGRVTVIGTGDYGLPDTAPGYYRSVYVVRADDPARTLADCAGYRYTLNDFGSQSGWGSPWADAVRQGLALLPTLVTGTHRSSMEAVAAGHADLAAIDAQTWWMDRGRVPARDALRVIGRTHATPGQSFVTAGARDPAPYASAIAEAIAALSPDHRATLGLRGIVTLPHGAYDLPVPRHPAGRKSARQLHSTRESRQLRGRQGNTRT